MAELILRNVRLAFPDLFTPRQVNGQGDPKYGATFLFSPSDQVYADVYNKMVEAANEKWGADGAKIAQQLFAGDRTSLHNGDLKEWSGFAGNMYLSANNTNAPGVYDSDRSELAKGAGRPYSGCFVNALVRFWAQDNQYGKRINCSLTSVQFAADGERFADAGSTPSPDAFDDLSGSVPPVSTIYPGVGAPAAAVQPPSPSAAPAMPAAPAIPAAPTIPAAPVAPAPPAGGFPMPPTLTNPPAPPA